MNREQLTNDLAPFADIGDSVVKVGDGAASFSVKMMRDGRPLKLSIEKSTGRVSATWGTSPSRSFSSIAVLLASEFFANLKKWADAQRDLLRKTAPGLSELIPLHGITHKDASISSIADVDAILGSQSRADG